MLDARHCVFSQPFPLLSSQSASMVRLYSLQMDELNIKIARHNFLDKCNTGGYTRNVYFSSYYALYRSWWYISVTAALVEKMMPCKLKTILSHCGRDVQPCIQNHFIEVIFVSGQIFKWLYVHSKVMQRNNTVYTIRYSSNIYKWTDFMYLKVSI